MESSAVLAGAGRRETQRMRMRTRLLDAALDLFAAQGYEGTTIDQIAGRADVARQTVLNHYPRKQDFVAAWAQRRRDKLALIGEREGPDVSAPARLHHYFAALARMNQRERKLTRILYLNLRLNEIAIHQRPIPDAVRTAIRDGRARGEFISDVDPDRAAEVLTAIYFDTLSRWLSEEPPSFDLAAVLSAKLDLVLRGLAAIPAPAPGTVAAST